MAGNHAIFVVKTNHARFPKAWLENTMKDFPGGTWVVLEGRTAKEADLLCLGYKYNTKKVLAFVVTKGAGSTVAGRPYEARFPDVYGNVHARNVPRPKVLNTYFDNCGAVDAHNQARQGNLALEECWVTHNSYFRIWTTILGMGVTDLWRLHKRFRHNYKNMTICTFANHMAFALLKRAEKWDNEAARQNQANFEAREKLLAGTYEFEQSNIPPASFPRGGDRETQSRCGIFEKFHTKIYLKSKNEEPSHVASPSTRNMGSISKVSSRARCMWCSRVRNIDHRTKLCCVECGVGFCEPHTGQLCWAQHVRNNGLPPHKKQRKN